MTPETRDVAWKGKPKLGCAALGVWSFSAPLKGYQGPVELVERRGEVGGIGVRNLLAPKRGRAIVILADKAGVDFREIWQGRGIAYDLASAAFCPATEVRSRADGRRPRFATQLGAAARDAQARNCCPYVTPSPNGMAAHASAL